MAENFEIVSTLITAYDLLEIKEGVEVGVRAGRFSRYLMENHPELYMIGVDPYIPYQDVHKFYDIEDQELEAARMRCATAVYGNRYNHVYLPSLEAAHKSVEANSVDFVFIDAEHTFDAVVRDITAWLPKIRQGGLICGHDYRMGGVGQAVSSIFGNRVRYSPPDSDVWWVRQ